MGVTLGAGLTYACLVALAGEENRKERSMRSPWEAHGYDANALDLSNLMEQLYVV